MIRELGITFAAVTETWFKGGAQLRQELGDVEQASGIKWSVEIGEAVRPCF